MDTRDVTLFWDDTNNIESGHKIYRSNQPFDTNNMPAPIGEVGTNVTTFVDESQPIGATVYYIVSAITPFNEVFSQPISFEVTPISFSYVGGNDGALIQYNNEGIQVWIDTTSTGITNIESDSSGNVIFSHGSTLTKFSSAGTKAWDYTATDTITSVTTDRDSNSIISFGSNVQLIDADGNEGWSFSNGTQAIVSIDHDDINNVVYMSDNLAIKQITNGTETNSWPIENVSIIKCDRFEYVYYAVGSSIYRYDTVNDITVGTDFVSTVNDLGIDESNGVYVAHNGVLRYLSFETSDFWTYDEYADNVTSVSLNSQKEPLITVGTRAVKLSSSGVKQWEQTYTDVLNSSEIYDGYSLVSPIDVDIDYRHFYEPNDLEFFSS